MKNKNQLLKNKLQNNLINNFNIYNAKVMHKRFAPRVNSFVYNVYYLTIPLDEIENLKDFLPYNKFGFLSFYDKDHAERDGKPIKNWVIKILSENNIEIKNPKIILVTHPRILGFVFNPVSFFLCFDEDEKLKCVISEVNNTFGETHSYICTKEDFSEIKPDDFISAKKLFFVSPFFTREGYYKFCFKIIDDKISIIIDYFNDESQANLITSLNGKIIPLNKKNLRKTIISNPLITFKTIFLIHYQAIKLIFKGIKYIRKPKQIEEKISMAQD
ncbi:MAG: DUF1365 domain-containing protein [Rickettsiales bacterium]|nr:DUF1365 domain-containing protein [Rickettsiales bacterium]